MFISEEIVGRCHKIFRGCSILYCDKSKQDIYNRLIAEGKKNLKNAGILTPHYKISSNGMCLSEESFTVAPHGLWNSSKKIKPASWNLSPCVSVP